MLLRRTAGLVFVLAALLGFAGSAAALPVTVYADGSSNFGFDPDDVEAAIDAGADEPLIVGTISFDPSLFEITTPNLIDGVKGKDRENPSKGSSTWTLHVDAETPEGLLENFALVILGHDPNDPSEKYKTENVGLEIDTEVPWLFVTPEPDDPFYVAFLLGDLVPGGSYEIPIEYRVAQKLKKKKNESGEKVLLFPRYSFAVVSGLPVPEPSSLALLLLGAGSAVLALRRAR